MGKRKAAYERRYLRQTATAERLVSYIGVDPHALVGSIRWQLEREFNRGVLAERARKSKSEAQHG